MAQIPENAKKPNDHRVSVKDKVFTWTTEDGDTLTIPLRVKMKVLRQLNDIALDAEGMFQMVTAVAPDQAAIIDEMDANDFTAAFEAWREAYAEEAEASLGESSSSSS
jgi:hypothetical protein